jgi:hypothetical protein
MHSLTRRFARLWCVDFEYHQPPGERPTPLCLVAREVLSGLTLQRWLYGEDPGLCPIPNTAQDLFIAYMASAEIGNYLALGWSVPRHILDLHAEFRALTNGRVPLHGYGLLGAMAAYGLDTIGVDAKDRGRALAIRGGPFTVQEQQDLLAYCAADVDGLVRLLPHMVPALDVSYALLRGAYMAASAAVEARGVPIDTGALARLQVHWSSMRAHVALEVNRRYPVFLPQGQRVLDPSTAYGATVLRTAAAAGVDAYLLAGTLDLLWHEELEHWQETRQAHAAARRQSHLTPALAARWEHAGKDASSWPGLDDTAQELADVYPAAFAGTRDDPAARVWELVRFPLPPRPLRHAPHLLRRAVALCQREDLQEWDGSPLTFSAKRFEQYLVRHRLAWPRLPSGALDLQESTFKDMAKVYRRLIGPIREVRRLLARLREPSLTVGRDGRNRTPLWPFSSKSGRNQPRASEYIFGPATWLRSLIKPGPGRAVAYLDWSQQELGIAAYLSQDPHLQDAYTSGDAYLTFAKMAGAVPQSATRYSHPAIRELYKTIMLGVLYGLSGQGAARRLDLPACDGEELLRHHHRVFPRFWAWSDAVEHHALLHGWLATCFQWPLQVTGETSTRSIRNYLMQANGAEMLRVATGLAVQRGLPVCALIHDAMMVEASMQDIDEVVSETQVAMRDASLAVLPGFPLRTEVKTVCYPNRYQDDRGVAVWRLVERWMARLEASSETSKEGEDEVPL